MTEYVNELQNKLFADRDFVFLFNQGVTSLFNKATTVFLNNEHLESKIIKAPNKIYYLILKRKDMFEIYHTKKDDNELPFNFEQNQLRKEPLGKLYSNSLAVIKVKAQFEGDEEEDDVEDILDLLDKNKNSSNDVDMKRLMKAMKKMTNSFSADAEKITSNPYVLSQFMQFMVGEKCIDSFDLNIIKDNPKLLAFVNKRLPEFSINIEFMKKVVKEQNFTKKERFTFNDCDNHVWKNGRFLLIENQNMIHCIDFQDKSNYVVYSLLSPHNGPGKKNAYLTNLLKDIKAGHVDDVDNVSLRVENGKAMFVDNAFISNLDFNLSSTADVLMEEGFGEIEYPIDTTQFDYQYAYCGGMLNQNKFEFLFYTLFVGGNGFYYDPKKGRVYSSIPYNPDMLNDFVEPQYVSDYETVRKVSYFSPNMSIKKLDEQWLAAFEFFVGELKQQKFDFSQAILPPNHSGEDVINYLQGVIDYNKKLNNTNNSSI